MKKSASKKPRLGDEAVDVAKGPSDPSPPIPTLHHTGGVATTFAKYGITNASEPEVLTWTTAPLDENQSILTKIWRGSDRPPMLAR